MTFIAQGNGFQEPPRAELALKAYYAILDLSTGGTEFPFRYHESVQILP